MLLITCSLTRLLHKLLPTATLSGEFSVALEHDYCARPKVLGNCDIPGFDGCYNCPHWRTNKNFLPILQDTLERTNKVLAKARNCGWELQVNKNEPIKHNLEKVVKSLEVQNNE